MYKTVYLSIMYTILIFVVPLAALFILNIFLVQVMHWIFSIGLSCMKYQVGPITATVNASNFGGSNKMRFISILHSFFGQTVTFETCK